MFHRAIAFAAIGLAAACASTAASAWTNGGNYANQPGVNYSSPPVYAPRAATVYAPPPVFPTYSAGDKNNYYGNRLWNDDRGRQRGNDRQRERW
jgi:hypothetical protein